MYALPEGGVGDDSIFDTHGYVLRDCRSRWENDKRRHRFEGTDFPRLTRGVGPSWYEPPRRVLPVCRKQSASFDDIPTLLGG